MPNGISASIYALIDRGAAKRPAAAAALRGSVEIHFAEAFAAVRVEFGEREVVVRDVEAESCGDADLVVRGSLPDIVQLAAAPLVGGVPRPTHARGRAALTRLARRRVKIEGNPLLARRLLRLLEI